MQTHEPEKAAAAGTIIEQIYKADALAGVLFENYLFDSAQKCISLYNGGYWTTDTEKPALMVINQPAKRVRLTAETNGCDVETDMRSASAACFVLALNHSIWHWHERGNKKLSLMFDKLWRKAQRAYLYGAKKSGLDASAIITFLD